MRLFKKREYIPIDPNRQRIQAEEKNDPKVPDGMWEKCPSCKKAIYTKDLGEFVQVVVIVSELEH